MFFFIKYLHLKYILFVRADLTEQFYANDLLHNCKKTRHLKRQTFFIFFKYMMQFQINR